MGLTERFDRMPFNSHLDIELVEAADGHAIGRIDLQRKHSSSPDHFVAHGGVAYALADTIGGAAVISLNQTVTPTIDMRIDYLAPATGGILEADATVVRNGSSVAVVEVEVTDDDDRTIAVARGTYKTGGATGKTAWEREQRRDGRTTD